VGDEQHAAFAALAEDVSHHAMGQRVVEVRRGLVEDQKTRIGEQRTRESDALPLSPSTGCR
jgi:hypothetical protein